LICCTYVVPNKKAASKSGLKSCPRRELNPHSRCGEQDFKSCVSTSSTTRAAKKKSRFGGKFSGAEDRARTGHLDLGKVAPYQMSYFRRLKELFSGVQN
jgi:hypothetical protein